jgi:dolichol-phosphate mannosyltransferase
MTKLNYKMRSSLAIIIPVYNEEEGIVECIASVFKVLKTLSIKSKIFVVNDGSTDNTLRILVRLRKKHKLKLEIVTHSKNKGYGLAIAEGIKKSAKTNFTYILAMDSDLTNNPKYIPLFLKKIEQGYDCIKGSRYIKGGGTKGIPLKRRVPSVLGNLFFRLFFNMGIKDYTNGFRIVKLSFLKNIKYKDKGFSHILEEMYYLKKKNAKVGEIPIILSVRKTGKSHFKYTPKVAYQYLKYPIMSLLINNERTPR